MAQIFISYRRQDSQYQADKLHNSIKRYVNNPKKDIFIDVDNIPPGIDFAEHLDDRVAQCDVLLALIGDSWLDIRNAQTGQRRLDDPEDFVRIEVATALRRGIAVVPVLLDGTKMPREEDLPEDLKLLARRNGIPVSRLSFASDVNRLMSGLGYEKRKTHITPVLVSLVSVLAAIAVMISFLYPEVVFGNESDIPSDALSEEPAGAALESDEILVSDTIPSAGIVGFDFGNGDSWESAPPSALITDPSLALDRIPRDCIAWPSQKVWNRGGVATDPSAGFVRQPGWRGYKPGKDVGQIITTVTHCDGYDIYILKVGENFVPIRRDGVRVIVESVPRGYVEQ